MPSKVRVARPFITTAIWPPLHPMDENQSSSPICSKYCSVFAKKHCILKDNFILRILLCTMTMIYDLRNKIKQGSLPSLEWGGEGTEDRKGGEEEEWEKEDESYRLPSPRCSLENLFYHNPFNTPRALRKRTMSLSQGNVHSSSCTIEYVVGLEPALEPRQSDSDTPCSYSTFPQMCRKVNFW